MQQPRPALLTPPAHLKNIRPLSGNAALSRWEIDVMRFMHPHYRTLSHFPRYFRQQGLNFQSLRQLLPEYFSQRYKTVLDVGCGTGFHSLLLSPHADRLVGIDIPGEYLGYVMPGFPSSSKMASYLVNECFEVNWAQFEDAFPDRVPLENESADLVFSWTVLEHVPELPPMFAEMARVVKPGGVMIHVVPAIMSGLSTLISANVTDAAPRKWSFREWLRPKRWVIPELHSEFLRGKADYNGQLDLYTTDTFVHPMLEAGFAMERLLWLRDFNVAIVTRKL